MDTGRVRANPGDGALHLVPGPSMDDDFCALLQAGLGASVPDARISARDKDGAVSQHENLV
jgi:hypothetical protein